MNKIKDRTTRLLEQYRMLNLNQDTDWEKFNLKEDKAAYYKSLTDSRKRKT